MSEEVLAKILVVLFIGFIIAVIILTFVLERKKRRKFYEISVQLLQSNFAELQVGDTNKGGLRSFPNIVAYSADPETTIQNLQLFMLSEKVGSSSVYYSVLNSQLRLKIDFPKDWTVKIDRQSAFDKFIFKENVELGIKHIDDAFWIKSTNVDIATKCLPYFQSFFEALNKRRDLRLCSLAFRGNILEYASKFKKTSPKKLPELFEIYKALINSVHKLEQAVEDKTLSIEQLTATEDQRTTKLQEKTLDEKNQLSKDFAILSNKELVNELKKRAPKDAEVKIEQDQIEIFTKNGFFQKILCKWTDAEIIFDTEAKIDKEIKMSLVLEAASLSSKKLYEWFDPFENLQILFEPDSLEAEIKKAYDIIRPFQNMTKKILRPKLICNSANGVCVLTLTVEKTANNISQAFELLNASSWKWLNQYSKQ